MDLLLQMFREGGASMFGVLGLDGCCCAAWFPVVLAGVFLRRGLGRRGVQVAAVLLAVGTIVPVVAGLAGRAMNRGRVEEALEMVDPEMREALMTQGYAESEHPFNFGLFSTLGLALLAVLPVGLAMREEKAPEEGEEA